MTPEQLREERMRIFTEQRTLIDGAREAKRGLNASEKERITTLDGELANLESLLDLAVRERDIDAKLARMHEEDVDRTDRAAHKEGEKLRDPELEYNRIFTKYMRSGMSLMSPQETQSLMAGQIDGDSQEARAMQKAIAELRDQGIATGVSGGFTVPQGFWAKITEVQKLFGGMLAVANNLDTDSGIVIPWPVNDDTNNEGEILGENVATTVLDLTFGTRSLGAFMFSSRMIRASLQLLQDSGVDVEGYIAKKAGQRIGRRLNRALTVGTGTGEPQGIITGATLLKQLPTGSTQRFLSSATPAAGDYRFLIDLIHTVDAAYRSGSTSGINASHGGDNDVDSPRWMMHDLTLAALRKLEDGFSRPLWAPSIQEGVPGTILGYPYTINNHMPTAAANAKIIAFGDFNTAYVARNVKGGSILRLSERYAEALQVAFLAFERHDGIVDDPNAFAVLQNSAT